MANMEEGGTPKGENAANSLSLAHKAFAVFEARIAAEVANDRDELASEIDDLQALHDRLKSLEIHVDSRVIASAGLDTAKIIKRDDGVCHLEVGFPEPSASISLSQFVSRNGAKLTISKQTVDSIPGSAPSAAKKGSDGVIRALLGTSYGHFVEGVLNNLSNKDVDALNNDKYHLAKYMMTRDGLDSPNATFTPRLVYVEMTPRLQDVIGLIGAHQYKITNHEIPLPNWGENVGRRTKSFELNDELSSIDLMRQSVIKACSKSDHRTLMDNYLFLKEKVNILSKIRNLMGGVEFCSKGYEAPLKVMFDKGFLGKDPDQEEPTWDIPIGNYAVAFGNLTSLSVAISGVETTVRNCSFYLVNSQPRLDIMFCPGVKVTASFGGPIVNEFSSSEEGLFPLLMMLMNHFRDDGDPLPPCVLRGVHIDLQCLSLDLSQVKDLLHLLHINVNDNNE